MHISWSNNEKKREKYSKRPRVNMYIYRLKYCFINIFRHERARNVFIKSFANFNVEIYSSTDTRPSVM